MHSARRRPQTTHGLAMHCFYTVTLTREPFDVEGNSRYPKCKQRIRPASPMHEPLAELG